MANDNKDKKEKEPALKPDEETLHTTDPQEKMKGPISSVMQNIKETAEEKGGETPDAGTPDKES
jgi:hypothetical protein